METRIQLSIKYRRSLLCCEHDMIRKSAWELWRKGLTRGTGIHQFSRPSGATDFQLSFCCHLTTDSRLLLLPLYSSLLYVRLIGFYAIKLVFLIFLKSFFPFLSLHIVFFQCFLLFWNGFAKIYNVCKKGRTKMRVQWSGHFKRQWSCFCVFASLRNFPWSRSIIIPLRLLQGGSLPWLRDLDFVALVSMPIPSSPSPQILVDDTLLDLSRRSLEDSLCVDQDLTDDDLLLLLKGMCFMSFLRRADLSNNRVRLFSWKRNP